ncbi:hypothetical protein [Paenibacillus ginsengarvi]|uniref:Uncharacterized protein n=1 Tax=Paenibacillus ginsengarvi TaxID=400777 RepID=A0A3B0CLX4_9BACL|nr:hypothetical protein [Paenibacillus ginsengarvi]RKN85871.1 hypothetical protein D7M11_05925 [Paenibacillus ginsengarvi]
MKRKGEQESVQPDVPQTPSARYTKEQFLKSRHRSGREKDILSAVLDDGTTCTIAETEAAMQAFLNKEAE